MKTHLVHLLTLAAVLTQFGTAHAQKGPEAGYLFPAGGRAGTTVDVHLGGYDWTPDMEFFVLEPGIKITPTGPLGPMLIPPPPYWFGAKGRLAAVPVPREMPARITIPADVPPGPVFWQAANANGATAAGVFIVSNGNEVVEDERRKGPQTLPALPVTVSGRLLKNEEIDQYRFRAPRDGPVTCELLARRIGAKFHGLIEVRDDKGILVADVAGTNGDDPTLTFTARAGKDYIIAIYDIDFGGDRSHVYRLSITAGPRVLGAIPAAGRPGETTDVEFVGIGVASGTARIESVKRKVTFPSTDRPTFAYWLETPWGAAPVFALLTSDLPETVGLPFANRNDIPAAAGITGVLAKPGIEHVYTAAWHKGQVWSLSLQARRIGSPLDVVLAVRGPDGKELARNDDLPETTDAGLDFTVPADGTYQIVVSDMAGRSGSLAAIYRLVVRPTIADFAVQLAGQRGRATLGGKLDLTVQAIRKGGFQGPISVNIRGLPPGVSTPPNLVIAAGQNSVIVPLQAAADAVPMAGYITVTGSGTPSLLPAVPSLKDRAEGLAVVTRTALAPVTVNLAPKSPDDNRVRSFLLASTLKPLFKGRPVDADTGRKVHRGSTFPAEVILERLDGYAGEITLQMGAQQSYQVHGITGGVVKVPPAATRALYPCYMPEWLESTRTSRVGMIAVARVPDARGKLRYLTGEITGFVTMTMEGALLKVSAEDQDLTVPAGRAFEVHLRVARLTKLSEAVKLELRVPEELAGKLQAESMTVAVGQEKVVLRVSPAMDLKGLHTFSIRGTAMQDGIYPAISEAEVTVEFVPVPPK